MYEMMEMREVLSGLLKEEMKKNPSIMVLDADLARANGTLALQQEFPERAIDVGIAESNMACIAAGLSSYGFLPFIFSFCPFVTRRICDQAAVSISYAQRNVKIVGTDPGISAELNGGTHMSVEDIGIMRSIPGMAIFEPVDGDQLARAMPQIFAYNGPMYIRLFRKIPSKSFFAEGNLPFTLWKAEVMREGSDVTLFSSGIEVEQAMDAAVLLLEQGIRAEVINVHTIKPLDTETVVASAKKTGCAVSCENHNIIGGLGSAVAETLSKRCPVPMEYIGIQDHFGEVGRMPFLMEKFHMRSEDIAETAKKVMEAKEKNRQ